MTKEEKIELVRGSGNVFRDFNIPDADVRHAKAKLAARIIGILDDEGLSVRAAEKKTGFNYADFSRVRNADVERYSLEFLIRMLTALDEDSEIHLDIRPRTPVKSGKQQEHRLRV